MSCFKQQQIEMASRGCVDATLKDWPYLADALGNQYPLNLTAIEMRAVCQRLLEKSATSGEHFSILDEEYGGREIWWGGSVPYEAIANWLGTGSTEISMLSYVNDDGDNPEREPWWREHDDICEGYDRGWLRVRGVEYRAVRYEFACPVGFYVPSEYVNELPRV